ncbi:MAG: hypothetical protein IH595_05365 [Bacteroidales bacterium]|nr:hypothetical protein [Bacteroidales bacterium]
MKRALLLFMVMLLVPAMGFSTDIITLKSGTIIRAKILTVNEHNVSYQTTEEKTGSVYTIPKTEVSDIYFESRSKIDLNSGKKSMNQKGSTATTISTDEPEESRFSVGFSGIYPTGTFPSTALTNMGTASWLKSQGHEVKSYGIGMNLQEKITEHFSIYLNMAVYNYNIFLAKAGSDVQSAWTVEEGATHWDEPGAPQILYVHNLPTDVHFDMQASGVKLGIKYILGTKKIRPWAGIDYGYYMWTANYTNGDKSKTYGKDNGTATGPTVGVGIDFKVTPGITLTPFWSGMAIIARYKIDGLFYPQWNYDSYTGEPIMGTSRFGLTLYFSTIKKHKNR